jgi:hypothetical protein
VGTRRLRKHPQLQNRSGYLLANHHPRKVRFPQCRNLVSVDRNPKDKLPSEYEGYASCPLFVGDGKLMLAEFKYGGIPDETFFKNQEV